MEAVLLDLRIGCPIATPALDCVVAIFDAVGDIRFKPFLEKVVTSAIAAVRNDSSGKAFTVVCFLSRYTTSTLKGLFPGHSMERLVIATLPVILDRLAHPPESIDIYSLGALDPRSAAVLYSPILLLAKLLDAAEPWHIVHGASFDEICEELIGLLYCARGTFGDASVLALMILYVLSKLVEDESQWVRNFQDVNAGLTY
jgi:hypothetical protein